MDLLFLMIVVMLFRHFAARYFIDLIKYDIFHLKVRLNVVSCHFCPLNVKILSVVRKKTNL